MNKFHRSLAKPKDYGKGFKRKHAETPEPVNRATRRAAKAMLKKSK